MLRILRNSVASIFTKILLGFIMLSFAIWGMGDIFSGGLFGHGTYLGEDVEKIDQYVRGARLRTPRACAAPKSTSPL